MHVFRSSECTGHAHSINATAKPTAAASAAPVNTSGVLERAPDFACVAAPDAFALGIGIGIMVPLAIVVLELPMLLDAVPPVVPSIGDVLDLAFFASAVKESMVRDWFVAGLWG